MDRVGPYRSRLYASLFSLLVTVIITVALWADRESQLSHADLLTSSMAQAVGQQIDGSLRSIEGLLEEISEAEKAGQWSNPTRRDIMASRLGAYPELLFVGIATPQGRLRGDTVPNLGLGAAGLDVSDRDYFRRHMHSMDLRAQIGQPVMDRMTKERMVTLSKPIRDERGNLLAVIVAGLSSDYYARILNSNLLDPDGATAAITLEGDILARAPQQAEKFAINIADSDLFRNFIPLASKGVARLVSKADGNDKILGYQVLTRYPVVVTSGLSVPMALKDWVIRSIAIAITTLCLLLLILYWAWLADARQARLKQHQATLEDMIRQRTAMLSDAQTSAERRSARLQAINDKLTRMAQITAHHLQEPLRPIVSFTQLAKRHLPAELAEVKHYLGFVEQGGLRLKLVLHAFQRYTEMLSHQPHLQKLDLNVMIQDVLERLADPITRHNIQVSIDSLPMAYGDPVMLDCALYELLSNAVAYRHPGRSPAIRIYGGDENGCWRLSIADNGPGMPESMSAVSMFQAFARPHSDKPDAIGLGLAMCLSIAEAHDGTLSMDSSAEGCTMTLHIPMETPPQP